MAYTSEIEKLEARFRENPKGRNFAPLADAYRKAGLVDNAIDLCETGLKLHPDYISAHIVYGRCKMDKKDDPGAQAVFRKVLELDPENVIALKILGEIAERNSQFDQTVEWLTRLLAADPMNGDAAEALARAKAKAAAAKPTPAPSIAEGPTAAMELPEVKAPIGIETFDGTLDVDPAAHAAAKADGLEVQEEVELNSQQVERVEIEGLARTQYEGSGMFKLDGHAEPAPPAAESADEGLPEVDLPLIMPEDLGPAPVFDAPPAPAPAPAPTPAPAPAPTPAAAPRVPAEVPAAVRLSDDDGAADAAALSQAEPVVTETMAELYLRQGHQQDALRVYQALLAQRPGDARLRARVAHLSGEGRKKSGVSAQAFLRGVFAGRGAAVAVAPPEPTPATTPEAAFDADAAAEGHPGEPTHPAPDHISLDTVFGEPAAREAAPEPADGTVAGAAPAPGGGFSFDQFFSGSARPGDDGLGEGPRTPGRSSGRTSKPVEDEGDLDQFQQWLKKLKS